jgi:hypothetical protein
MPQQKRGESKQDVGTPRDFIQAACRKLGIFAFGLDLAATSRNSVASRYFSPREDCFKQPSWKAPGKQWSWLNPEFDNIGKYAERCLMEMRSNDAKIAFLTPASVGSNWYRDFIHKQRGVLQLNLNGRIKFVGHKDPYPKDLMLTLFAPYLEWDTEIWRWQ